MHSDAVFDTTGTYRYRLTRQWNADLPCLCFVMLNPGTADATHDDPTMRRCIGLAQRWGFGRLEVVNLFAFRTSYPKALRQAADPIGPENDAYLQTVIRFADAVVVAWGNHGVFQNRDQAIRPLLSEVFCLGLTKQGHPRHPLYVPNTVQRIPFR